MSIQAKGVDRSGFSSHYDPNVTPSFSFSDVLSGLGSVAKTVAPIALKALTN